MEPTSLGAYEPSAEAVVRAALHVKPDYQSSKSINVNVRWMHSVSGAPGLFHCSGSRSTRWRQKAVAGASGLGALEPWSFGALEPGTPAADSWSLWQQKQSANVTWGPWNLGALEPFGLNMHIEGIDSNHQKIKNTRNGHQDIGTTVEMREMMGMMKKDDEDDEDDDDR